MKEKLDQLYEKYKHLLAPNHTASFVTTINPPSIWSSSKKFIEAFQKELGGTIEKSDQEFGGWFLNIESD